VTSLTDNINITKSSWTYPTVISYDFINGSNSAIVSFMLDFKVDAISSDPALNTNAIAWDYTVPTSIGYANLVIYLPYISNYTVNTTKTTNTAFVTASNASMVVYERSNFNSGFSVRVTFPMVVTGCSYTGFPLNVGGILGLVLGLPGGVVLLGVIVFGSMYIINKCHDIRRSSKSLDRETLIR
jgi:hypothetical protein